ncbi:MAG: DUF2934 domain-containing protein [Acidobacteria bacterium]|nr:DUF2934 domain-containing protein [Acidobacteriota bacterium]
MPRKSKSELISEVSESVPAAASAPEKEKRARTRTVASRHTSRKKAPAVAEAAAAPACVDHQEIARLAYMFWEARGCQGGCPEEDWHRAEEQLKARGAAAGA